MTRSTTFGPVLLATAVAAGCQVRPAPEPPVAVAPAATDPPAPEPDLPGPADDRVTLEAAYRLKLGMTRAELEAVLGPGQPPPAGAVARAVPGERWQTAAAAGRVVGWRNRDFVLWAVFHTRPTPAARVRSLLAGRPPAVEVVRDAWRDEEADALFPPLVTPDMPFAAITPGRLAQAYRADPAGAAARYTEKVVELNGVVAREYHDWFFMEEEPADDMPAFTAAVGGLAVVARADLPPPAGVACYLPPGSGPLPQWVGSGVAVKVRGTCGAPSVGHGGVVAVRGGLMDRGTDPGVTVRADHLAGTIARTGWPPDWLRGRPIRVTDVVADEPESDVPRSWRLTAPGLPRPSPYWKPPVRFWARPPQGRVDVFKGFRPGDRLDLRCRIGDRANDGDWNLHGAEPLTPPPDRGAEPPVRLTAGELNSLFLYRWNRADALYRGRVLEVTGTVAAVEAGGPGPVVRLGVVPGQPAGLGTLAARFDADPGPLPAVGQPLTVRGTCGPDEDRLPVLTGCVVVPPPAPAPLPRPKETP